MSEVTNTSADIQKAADKALAELRRTSAEAARLPFPVHHEVADQALVGFFRDIGRADIVEEWNKIEKWYEKPF